MGVIKANMNYEDLPKPDKKAVAVILLEIAKDEDNPRLYIEMALHLLKGN